MIFFRLLSIMPVLLCYLYTARTRLAADGVFRACVCVRFGVQHAYVSRKWRSSACYRSHQISIIRWWFLMHIWLDCHLTFLKLVLMDCCVHSFSATFFHRTFVRCIHADVVVHTARLPQALTIHDNSQLICASIDFWSSDHSVHLYLSVSVSHSPRQRSIVFSPEQNDARIKFNFQIKKLPTFFPLCFWRHHRHHRYFYSLVKWHDVLWMQTERWKKKRVERNRLKKHFTHKRSGVFPVHIHSQSQPAASSYGDATSFMVRVIQDIASRARLEFSKRNRR